MSDYYIHPTAVIDDPVEIGQGAKIWHFCHVMTQAKIGDASSLGQNVFVAGGVKIGNRVKIQNNVSIYAGVTLEDEVFVGPSVVFTNVKNPRSAVNRQGAYLSTHLEKGVTVGANATIVCGIRLGAFCFVGAGAVVTRDIPPYALVLGNPARQVGWMSEFGHRLIFGDSNIAVCPEEGSRYRLNDGRVTRL